jgi:hypothetical protein
MKKITIGHHSWDCLYFKKGYYFIINKEELKSLAYDVEKMTFNIDGKTLTYDCEVIYEQSRVDHILKHMIEFNIHRFDTYSSELVSIRLYEKSA